MHSFYFLSCFLFVYFPILQKYLLFYFLIAIQSFIYLFYLCTNIIVMKNCKFVLGLQMLKKKKGPLVNKRNFRPNSEKTAALAPFQLR